MSDQNVTIEQVQEFAGKVMADIGGAYAVLLSYLGDQSGIYRTLTEHGPMSCQALADKAGVDGRYLLEWLSAQAAAGYVEYDEASECFSMLPHKSIVLAQEGHPACMQGLFQCLVAQYATHDKALEIFVSGAGRPWGEHHSCCFCGTDRFFRPGYEANLITDWLPALDGMTEKLQRGARVADVGCGHGSSTILMAEAFKSSHFVGYDFHAESIAAAAEKADKQLDHPNWQFVTAKATDIQEGDFDLICLFDALHDMGDPVGVARHLRSRLVEGGSLMLVEPLAGDKLTDNLHLLGQIFYSASTLICTPASKAQEVGLALGAQAGEKRLTQVLTEAGFTSIRRVAQTDTNMVLEARMV
ncbi:class I SAM-dependent methyltransferase [Bowmanella dokdonensis]|uniref:Class I SAM-dependent methyltransferase n=1 Tax=Bowmanella dokdonensis TaxID=751969 RepID=A0A939DMN9_9ALTE|nr:class I SAM-dependent methyltransferase [Bowmanella dokdonensis]MBN7825399.1 class I SAM-dependent methyltransferase [Bowmanella dokdonensis]